MNKYESAKVRNEIIKTMAHPARCIIIEVFKFNEKDQLFSELFTLFDCRL